MRQLFILLLTLLANLTVQAQPVARNVIVEHFTNTYCSVCANRNPGFYNNLRNFPQVFHIAYYPSLPYPACPLNQHNKQEQDARAQYYNVFGATPRIVVQGKEIPAGSSYDDPALFQTELGQTSAFQVEATLWQVSTKDMQVKVLVRKMAQSSLSNLELYAAVVEDTLFFTANNGETMHINVFRRSVFGPPHGFTAPQNIGDTVSMSVMIPMDSAWRKDRIYVMAMLQEPSKEMVQVFRSERLMNLGMSPGPVVGALRVYPNPATDKLFIAGSEDLVSYRLYDLRGALVSSASYTQPVVPLAGLQPGVYFLTVYSGRNCGTLRFVKH